MDILKLFRSIIERQDLTSRVLLLLFGLSFFALAVYPVVSSLFSGK